MAGRITPPAIGSGKIEASILFLQTETKVTKAEIYKTKSFVFFVTFCSFVVPEPKLFPTTIPTTEPIIAPATKSEYQWMVMETPKPM